MTTHFIRYLCAALILLASVSAVAGAPQASPAVMKLLEEGSRYYLKHQYTKAIGPYAKALELEKKQATLDDALTRMLIDNLGMAYGISGDLASAKATFEYGVSRDKTYPMYYYNLACTYAEMNDLEGTIANLDLAFKYRDNVTPGEHFPDPAKDSSFQRFLKNERFIRLLRESSAAQ